MVSLYSSHNAGNPQVKKRAALFVRILPGRFYAGLFSIDGSDGQTRQYFGNLLPIDLDRLDLMRGEITDLINRRREAVFKSLA